MKKELRRVYVVSLDGCIHDGDSAEYGTPNADVIAIMQRERELHHAVFIVETRNREFRSDVAATLNSWGIGFCFYNTDPDQVMQVLSTEFECQLVYWNRVEDVLLSDCQAVCREYASERDLPSMGEELCGALSRVVYLIDTAKELLDSKVQKDLAESVASLEFTLEAFKIATCISEAVTKERVRIVDEQRPKLPRAVDSRPEATE